VSLNSGLEGNKEEDDDLRVALPEDVPAQPGPSAFFFFFTLVTGPRRSWSLKLRDTRVYEPQIPSAVRISLNLTESLNRISLNRTEHHSTSQIFQPGSHMNISQAVSHTSHSIRQKHESLNKLATRISLNPSATRITQLGSHTDITQPGSKTNITQPHRVT